MSARTRAMQSALQIFLMTVCCISSSEAPASADTEPSDLVLRLGRERVQHKVGPFVEYLVDPDGGMTIHDVMSADFAARFQPLDASNINMGITPDTYWFRFSIASDVPVDEHPNTVILHISRPFIQSFQLYLPPLPGNTIGDSWTVIRAGEREMTNGSPPPLLDFSIPISETPQTMYIRARDNAIMYLPLDVYSLDAYRKHMRYRMLMLGLYVGIIVAMLLYNLFIYRTIHHPSYLWYVLYTASLSIFILGTNGFTYEYIHRGSPEAMIRTDLLFLGIAFFCIVQFTRGFLGSRTEFPTSDRILLGMMIPVVLVVTVTPFAALLTVNNSYSLLGLMLVTVFAGIAAAAIRRRVMQAAYYLFAIGIVAVSGIIYSLAVRGILPMTALTFHSLQIGSATEAIVLSLALANRISNIRRDRDLAVNNEKRYRQLAITDELTGLYNARFFRDRLKKEIRLAHRYAAPFCLIMLDVDHFKQFNDMHGHLEGDRLLAHLGSVIQRSVREMDVSCRCGGEEFGVILPGATGWQAHEISERIRRTFIETNGTTEHGSVIAVTLSAGAAELRGGESDCQLIKRADRALYVAKESGRNRTVMANVSG